MQTRTLRFLYSLFFLFCFSFQAIAHDFPVLFKGRFQPADAYARTWFYEFYHAPTIESEDLLSFHTTHSSALEWLESLHFQGHFAYQAAPLFWVNSAELKQLAQVPAHQKRLSAQVLNQTFYSHPTSSPLIAQRLITYYFSQAYTQASSFSMQPKFELSTLLPGLWVQLKNQQLIIKSVPANTPWNFLKPGVVIGSLDPISSPYLLKKDKKFIEETTNLMQLIRRFESLKGPMSLTEQAYHARLKDLQAQSANSNNISKHLEQEFPLEQRLKKAGMLFLALPWKHHPDEWLSLHALALSVYSPTLNRLIPIANFTPFSDELFVLLQKRYQVLPENKEPFLETLKTAYQSLEGQVYQEAYQKQLHYPTRLQLKAESFYTQTSWTFYLIGLYLLSLIFLIISHVYPTLKPLSWVILGLTFFCHTLLLLTRCFILGRPPVSNMAETVIYVPWITMLCALAIPLFRKQFWALLAACCAAISLLSILEWTQLNQNFDQLQAVLDSQFWLMTHVLLVVGSYGLFLFSAVLGHLYLGLWLTKSQSPSLSHSLTPLILQTLYGGTALLIIGTILGGIWAAESWGRFWDWDPKESWAFISSCFYLIWIHAYRFHHIASFGLAIGAVSGFLAISFTWYGVNYILGTGLHSYGFGSGGEEFYYAYFMIELLLIISTLFIYHYRNRFQTNY